MSCDMFTPEAGPGEEWRPCPDFPNYHVSNYGRIKGPRGKINRLRRHNGYWLATLRRNGKQGSRVTSRLAARAFLGEPPDPHLQAAHWDGNRDNNHISNLRWATVGENTEDKRRHGSVLAGEGHPRAFHSWKQIEQIRTDYEIHMTERREQGFNRCRKGFRKELCAKYEAPLHRIKDILNQRCWTIESMEKIAA